MAVLLQSCSFLLKSSMYHIFYPIYPQLREAYMSLLGKDDRHVNSSFKSIMGKLALGSQVGAQNKT